MRTIVKAGRRTGGDPFVFVLSDGRTDRMGDVVEPGGWKLAAFAENPIALYGHDQGHPIGRWADVHVDDAGRLVGRLELAAAGTSGRIDEIRALVEQGILRAVSVGFRPLRSEPIPGGTRYVEHELVEVSVVAVPANPRALAAVKALDTIRRLSSRTALSAAKPHPKKEKTMRLAQKIEVAEGRLSAIRDELTRLIEGEDDADTDAVDTLNDEAKALERTLSTLKSTEAILVGNAAAAPARRAVGAAGRVPAAPRAEADKPGSLIVRAAVCHAMSMVRRQDAATVARELYTDTGRDPRVETIVRSGTAPATTTNPTWAAELMIAEVRAFVDDLAAMSVAQRLAALGTQLTFGAAGVVVLPRRGTARLAGSFVGEGRPIPVKQGALRSVVLDKKKLAVITAFSREVFENTSGEIERICREMIVADTAAVLDAALFDGAAGTPIRPASIRMGASTAASAGNTFANVVADLKAAFAAIIGAGGGGKLAVIVNPLREVALATLIATDIMPFAEQIAQGKLLNATLISSPNVPTDAVIVVDAAHFVSAIGVPVFDTSTEATLVLLNDDGIDPYINAAAVDPAAGVGRVSGAATIPGGPARVSSLWQEDAIGLRMHLPVTWAMTKNGVVAEITGVAW